MNFLVENLAKMLLKPQYSKPNSIPLNLEIDEGYLRDIVEELSFERVYRTPANVKARDIIVREFTKIFDHQPMLGDPPFDNIIFGNPNHATKLVGAHYDSVPGSPGADDNASAVAVMLAVAKHSRAEGVCFVAFNSEEYGLAGSKAFVDNWKPNQLKQAHILEMVGYCKHTPNSQINPLPFLPLSDVGNFIGIVGNDGSFVNHIIKQAGVASIPAVGLSIPSIIGIDRAYEFSPDIFRSDHANFWEAKIPAVMWTDTSNFRNPNYHGAGDIPDTLDYGFMAQVAKILVQVVMNE